VFIRDRRFAAIAGASASSHPWRGRPARPTLAGRWAEARDVTGVA
jgi:hypothetical protein